MRIVTEVSFEAIRTSARRPHQHVTKISFRAGAGYLDGERALRGHFAQPHLPFTMKKVLFLAVAALSLSLTSCGGKAEEATEKKADAVQATADAGAATLQARADSLKKAGEKAADNVKDAAGNVKDAAGNAVTDAKAAAGAAATDVKAVGDKAAADVKAAGEKAKQKM